MGIYCARKAQTGWCFETKNSGHDRTHDSTAMIAGATEGSQISRGIAATIDNGYRYMEAAAMVVTEMLQGRGSG